MIELDIRYWDCECGVNFQHPMTEPICRVCGAAADEQPNSRVLELMTQLPGYRKDEQCVLMG